MLSKFFKISFAQDLFSKLADLFLKIFNKLSTSVIACLAIKEGILI